MDDNKNPDIDKKKELEYKPLYNKDMINTLKKSIEKYSFFPKKYKTIKFKVLARPNFIPGPTNGIIKCSK